MSELAPVNSSTLNISNPNQPRHHERARVRFLHTGEDVDNAACQIEMEVSDALDEFEALVISYITDFLNLQQVYDPNGIGNSPMYYNMEKKLEELSDLLKHFDPETQKLLEIQVLNELHAEQRNWNIAKGNPCVKPLTEVQELVLQFKSEVSQAAAVSIIERRRNSKKDEMESHVPCGPFQNRTNRLSQLIADLKNCLTASHIDNAERMREQQRKLLAIRQKGEGTVAPMRLPSPRVIPASHFKRVFDTITSGDDCCNPCPSVYTTSVLWKRYQGPPHLSNSERDLGEAHTPILYGTTRSNPELGVRGAHQAIQMGAFEQINRSHSYNPFHMDPNKFRLLTKKLDAACCTTVGETPDIATKNFNKMLNNESSGIHSFEETMRAYTRLANSVPLVWAGFGPRDEPLLFPATGHSFTQLPLNPNITLGGYPWQTSSASFTKFGLDGNGIYRNRNWDNSETSFLEGDEYYSKSDIDVRHREHHGGGGRIQAPYHLRHNRPHPDGRDGVFPTRSFHTGFFRRGEGNTRFADRRKYQDKHGNRRDYREDYEDSRGDRRDTAHGHDHRDFHGDRRGGRFHGTSVGHRGHVGSHRGRADDHESRSGRERPRRTLSDDPGSHREGRRRTRSKVGLDSHGHHAASRKHSRRGVSDDPETYRKGGPRKPGGRTDDADNFKDGRRKGDKLDQGRGQQKGERGRAGRHRDDFDDHDAASARIGGRGRGGRHKDDFDYHDAASARKGGRGRAGRHKDDFDYHDAASARKGGRGRAGRHPKDHFDDDDAAHAHKARSGYAHGRQSVFLDESGIARGGGRGRKGEDDEDYRGDGHRRRNQTKNRRKDGDLDADSGRLDSGGRRGKKGKGKGRGQGGEDDLDDDEGHGRDRKSARKKRDKKKLGKASDGTLLSDTVLHADVAGGDVGGVHKKGIMKWKKKRRGSDESSDEGDHHYQTPRRRAKAKGDKSKANELTVAAAAVPEVDLKAKRAMQLEKMNKSIANRLNRSRPRKANAGDLDATLYQKKQYRKPVPDFKNRARRIKPPDARGFVIGESGDDDVFYPLSKLDKQSRRERGEYGEDIPTFAVNATTVNSSWELASSLFKTKTPYHAMAIPPPENLLSFVQNKYPMLKWSTGPPRAVRYYPNGDIFCASFKNGSGLVFYPHGGLAIAISSPMPFNHVVVMRDPYDKFYFLDKSVLADFDCIGKGAVFHIDGVTQMQYNTLGGFRNDGMNKLTQRWQWNRGGQRMVLKLNRFISLRMLDLTRIHLVFYGNKRGLRFNVGPDDRVISLIKLDPHGGVNRRPEPAFPDNYDYFHGKFNPPIMGFMDKTRPEQRTEPNTENLPQSPSRQVGQGDELPQLAYEYSFRQCEKLDQKLPPLVYDRNETQCAINPPGTSFLC